MKGFKDLKFVPSHIAGGIKCVMFFDNGYGVSVIQQYGSYGYEDGLYELAVFKGDENEAHIDYTTDITQDVLGHCTETDITTAMIKVQNLNRINLKTATCILEAMDEADND